MTYGLAGPFAHPVRTLAMLLAVAFGTVAATFALGLTASLNAVGSAQDPEDRAPVTVFTGQPHSGPGGAGTATADPAQVTAAIKQQSGTDTYYGRTQTDGTAAGVPGAVQAVLYDGDLRSAAYEMISGHWITGPGQVVVSTHFLNTTETEVGDTLRVTVGKQTRTLTIVGEAFDTSDDGLRFHASLADFPTVEPQMFLVDVKPGVQATPYAMKLDETVSALGAQAIANSSSRQDNLILVLDAMAALLTLMLVSVAGLGVLNSVVLDTRERVHDLGVCKALGMSPRQTVSLVLASVAGIGVAGGLIGVPVGYALHGYVLPKMAETADTGLPKVVLDVYDTPELLLLGCAGILIAVLGALLPASWAAKARTATALRTE